jgi:hypothetical protein
VEPTPEGDKGKKGKKEKNSKEGAGEKKSAPTNEKKAGE